MIKNTVVIIFVLCFFVMLADYLKPSVTVYNNSGSAVFLYKGTGEKNVEPDIEQAESSMKPVLINNDKHKKVILSWVDLYLINGQLYLGWNAKKKKGSVDFVSSGRVFDITSGVGYCSYNVYIGRGSETIKSLKGILCLKKLSISPDK